MTTVLKVDNLGKKYLINHQQNNGYKSLREVVSNKSKAAIASFNIFNKNSVQNKKSIEENKNIIDNSISINAYPNPSSQDFVIDYELDSYSDNSKLLIFHLQLLQ